MRTVKVGLRGAKIRFVLILLPRRERERMQSSISVPHPTFMGDLKIMPIFSWFIKTCLSDLNFSVSFSFLKIVHFYIIVLFVDFFFSAFYLLTSIILIISLISMLSIMLLIFIILIIYLLIILFIQYYFNQGQIARLIFYSSLPCKDTPMDLRDTKLIFIQ